MKSKIWISFGKLTLNLIFIYICAKAIQLVARSLDYYIPLEFTFLILLIVYLTLSHFFRKKTVGYWLLSLTPRYRNYLSALIILLILIFFGNVFLKFKKVYDVANAYSKYSDQEPDYTDRDLNSLVDISSVDTFSISQYVNWLNENGQTPVSYILEKISQYQVIVFGEVHQFSNYLSFLNNNIPYFYKAGIRVIAMEVCRKSDNKLLNELVTAKYYDNDLALEIARHNLWLAWGFKDYWDVLKAVWSFNSGLKGNLEKIAVIGLETDADMPSISLVLPSDDGKTGPFYEKFRIFRTIGSIPYIGYRDELMAKEIEEKIILKDKKGIAWVGSAHSYLNYKQPLSQKGRMSYILYKKYRDRIFQIFLHYNDYSERIADFLETAVQKSRYHQIGFDIMNSPFNYLRDSTSVYFINRSKICFGDIAQGYVYLEPIDSLVHCNFIPNFVTREMFIKEKSFFEAVTGRSFKNVSELNKYYIQKFGN